MNISINKPCHEDWSKMTPNEKGAFCAVCTKDVVDFSEKTVQEIKEFFARPIKGKVCGRFKEDQLDEISLESFIERFVGFKLSKKVLVIVALTFASWFMGTSDLTAQTKVKMGKVAPVKTNTVTPTKNEDEHVKGKVKIAPKDTTKCTKPNTEKMKMGEVAAPPKKEKLEKKPIKKAANSKEKKKEEPMLLGDVNVIIDEKPKK